MRECENDTRACARSTTALTPEHLIIEVCRRDEAGAILCSPSQRADIAFLISIGDE